MSNWAPLGPPVYTLIASDAVLTARIRERENHGFKDTVLALSLNREIAAASVPHHQVIDTTMLSPQAVADRIAPGGADR